MVINYFSRDFFEVPNFVLFQRMLWVHTWFSFSAEQLYIKLWEKEVYYTIYKRHKTIKQKWHGNMQNQGLN